MAVHEKSGDIVQVTEGGYLGMLNVSRKSMKLYFMRRPAKETARGSLEIVEVDLAKVFADSKADSMQPADVYQRVCGVTPPEWEAGGIWPWMARRVGLVSSRQNGSAKAPTGRNENRGIFRSAKNGGRPGGCCRNECQNRGKQIRGFCPFQVGHIQSNPWVPGQIVFCWETGVKRPANLDSPCRRNRLTPALPGIHL